MQTVQVPLQTRSYPIHIGGGLLTQPGLLLAHLPQKQIAIVTNPTVGGLYLAALSDVLSTHGVKIVRILVPDGEQYKNWETLNAIFDQLLAHRCERKTTILALGGGVIGDLAGFAAATYLRGVPFI
ncbi:MAG: iron-containing alcohol dehydrogenase, partial [Betaproteobacteria bacterium]